MTWTFVVLSRSEGSTNPKDLEVPPYDPLSKEGLH